MSPGGYMFFERVRLTCCTGRVYFLPRLKYLFPLAWTSRAGFVARCLIPFFRIFRPPSIPSPKPPPPPNPPLSTHENVILSLSLFSFSSPPRLSGYDGSLILSPVSTGPSNNEGKTVRRSFAFCSPYGSWDFRANLDCQRGGITKVTSFVYPSLEKLKLKLKGYPKIQVWIPN